MWIMHCGWVDLPILLDEDNSVIQSQPTPVFLISSILILESHFSSGVLPSLSLLTITPATEPGPTPATDPDLESTVRSVLESALTAQCLPEPAVQEWLIDLSAEEPVPTLTAPSNLFLTSGVFPSPLVPSSFQDPSRLIFFPKCKRNTSHNSPRK